MIIGESQFKHPKYSGSPLRPPTFSSGENGSGGRGHPSMFNVRGNLERREYILSRNLHGVALGFFRRRGGGEEGWEGRFTYNARRRRISDHRLPFPGLEFQSRRFPWCFPFFT